MNCNDKRKLETNGGEDEPQMKKSRHAGPQEDVKEDRSAMLASMFRKLLTDQLAPCTSGQWGKSRLVANACIHFEGYAIRVVQTNSGFEWRAFIMPKRNQYFKYDSEEDGHNDVAGWQVQLATEDALIRDVVEELLSKKLVRECPSCLAMYKPSPKNETAGPCSVCLTHRLQSLQCGNGDADHCSICNDDESKREFVFVKPEGCACETSTGEAKPSVPSNERPCTHIVRRARN